MGLFEKALIRWIIAQLYISMLKALGEHMMQSKGLSLYPLEPCLTEPTELDL
jgi:hypothetical protein